MFARRTPLAAASLIATMLLLSACVPAKPDAATTPSAPAATATTSTETAVPAPEASPTPAVETGVAVGIECSELITPQQMYDYNPNFGLAASFTPDSGTLAAQAVAVNGLACRWVNQTSGVSIDVSVAHLDSTSNQARKDSLAANSTSVSRFGPDGYFDQGDLGSAAQAFPGEYWVTATSTAFFTAEDAQSLMIAATGAVG